MLNLVSIPDINRLSISSPWGPAFGLNLASISSVLFPIASFKSGNVTDPTTISLIISKVVVPTPRFTLDGLKMELLTFILMLSRVPPITSKPSTNVG